MSLAVPARLVLIALLLSGGLASSCSKQAATQQGGGSEAGGAGRGGRGGGGPVPVVTARSVSKSMPVSLPAVGTAEPAVTVQVRAQVTGQLSRIHFREGQDVRKGDTLFSIDSRPFDAALSQAEAVLARDLAQAKNASSQTTRSKELFDRGLIPRDQFETQTATSAALDATLAADRSQVENAKLNLQYTTIKAPVSGRTGALSVHEGDLVRANDTAPLIVINQVAPIYVSFSIPGRYLPDVRQNQARKALRIEVHNQPGGAPGAEQVAPVSADKDAPRPAADPQNPPPSSLHEGGVVSFIDNSVDPTTGTIKLKGTFPNEDHALWPGLFVQVTLVLSTESNATVVPAAAVQTSQDGQYVFVVKSDRTVEYRAVQVDRQVGEEMVIGKGLAAGEEVVTDGHLRLTNGAHVVTGTRGQPPPSGAAGGGAQGERSNENGRRAGREGTKP